MPRNSMSSRSRDCSWLLGRRPRRKASPFTSNSIPFTSLSYYSLHSLTNESETNRRWTKISAREFQLILFVTLDYEANEFQLLNKDMEREKEEKRKEGNSSSELVEIVSQILLRSVRFSFLAELKRRRAWEKKEE